MPKSNQKSMFLRVTSWFCLKTGVTVLGTVQFFGEKALLENENRTATAGTRGDLICAFPQVNLSQGQNS